MSLWLAQAKTFVREKEESLVAIDRPAQESTKVILTFLATGQWPLGRQYGVIEPIVRVQLVIPEVIENPSVKCISSGAGLNDDLPPRSSAIFGSERGCLNAEFLHGVNRRRVERIHDHRILLDAHRAHAIHQNVGRRIPATVRDEVVGHVVRPERIPGRLVNPRRQHCQVEDLTAVERKIIYEGPVQVLPCDGVFSGESWGLRRNFDGFRSLADLQ